MPAPVAEELKARSRDFAIILYPDEDSNHRTVFNYIINHDRLYSSVWIKHDKDINDDGTLKKPHIHMYCHLPKQTTISGFLKSLSNIISYAEPVHNEYSYLLYMIHDTITADSDGKYLYDVSELKGNCKIISKVFEQNEHFVQLGEFAEMCQNGFKISNIILDTLSIKDTDKRKIAIDTFKEYSHLIACMSNQELNELARKRGNSKSAEYYPQESMI